MAGRSSPRAACGWAPTPLSAAPRGPIDVLLLPGGSGVEAACDDQRPRRLHRRRRATCPAARDRLLGNVPRRGRRPARRPTGHHPLGACRRSSGRGTRRSTSTPTRSSCATATCGPRPASPPGIDLALALVEDDHGADVAQSVARWLVMFLRRPGGQTQFATPVWSRPAARAGRSAPPQDLDRRRPGRRPSRVGALAGARRDERASLHPLFTAQVGATPASTSTLSAPRRRAAALESTADTVDAIARRCGFGTAETMRRTFAAPPRRLPRRLSPPISHRSLKESLDMQVAIPLFPRFTALDGIGPYEVLQRIPDARHHVRRPRHGP